MKRVRKVLRGKGHALDHQRPVRRRHLGRKDVVSSLDELRSAIAHYLRLDVAFKAHSSDEKLERMWGEAIDTIIFAQAPLAKAGIAIKGEDGSIVTDLGDGRELVVWPFMCVEPDRKVLARGWLARRDASTKLDRLGDALAQAMTVGDPVPNDLFGALQSKVSIRQRPLVKATGAADRNLLQQLRTAVARHERAKLEVETCPSDSRATSEDKAARLALASVMLQHIQDGDAIVREEADGSHSCDLADGREVVVKVVLDKKVRKKDRARRIAWLEGRGKKRLEDLVDEVWRALSNGDNVDDLFFKMYRIEITLRRKKIINRNVYKLGAPS